MKEAVKFLQDNPVQYLATAGWNGTAVFEENVAVKENCMSNPIFQVFYLEDARAVIADFSGEPPKENVL